MLLLQHETGHYNWASKVQSILTENGFGIVWLCQGVGYASAFVAEFKTRLTACYMQDWHYEMQNNDRYKWFFSFKSVYQSERYLTVLTKKWYSDSLVRFRFRASGLKSA